MPLNPEAQTPQAHVNEACTRLACSRCWAGQRRECTAVAPRLQGFGLEVRGFRAVGLSGFTPVFDVSDPEQNTCEFRAAAAVHNLLGAAAHSTCTGRKKESLGVLLNQMADHNSVCPLEPELDPKPYTPNPKPETLNPNPEAPDPKPKDPL